MLKTWRLITTCMFRTIGNQSNKRNRLSWNIFNVSKTLYYQICKNKWDYLLSCLWKLCMGYSEGICIYASDLYAELLFYQLIFKSFLENFWVVKQNNPIAVLCNCNWNSRGKIFTPSQNTSSLYVSKRNLGGW